MNALTPFEADLSTATSATSPLPVTKASILEIDHPNVALST
jgi:hypothetical protein